MILLDRVVVTNGTSFTKEYNFRFLEGRWSTITGPSGVGKTSLLELIAGLRQPESGVLEIGGKNALNLPPGKRGVAMVCQDSVLFPHLSLLKNLLLAQHDIDLTASQKLAAVEQAISLFSLASSQLARLPREVSGGELTRFNICSALLRRKPILILDEPLASLNSSLQKTVAGALEKIAKKEKLTVLCVSHQLEEVRNITDDFFDLT